MVHTVLATETIEIATPARCASVPRCVLLVKHSVATSNPAMAALLVTVCSASVMGS
ncbi:MAG: hypothetical protein JO059_07215 [Mycobacterium sp.]|nr:hypothetical protein [Mycobacterium sp.]MBW0012936.1 hypothetical protein [Mycobacterium sp.]